MAVNAIQVGPWGGKAGNDRWKSVVPSPDTMRLKSITLSTGGCVFSLAFCYMTNDDTREFVEKIGGEGGTPETVTFSDGEDIVGFNGTFEPYHGITVITSLSFETNKPKVYGPFGREGRYSFSLPVTKGKLTGFFGRKGIYIDSIGAVVVPE